MDPNAYQVLLRLNPWVTDLNRWPECTYKYIPDPSIARRTTLSPQEKRLNLIIGPRQSGKSTLIWHLLSKAERPHLYLNCEEPSIRDLFTSPALFLNEVEHVAPDSAGFF